VSAKQSKDGDRDWWVNYDLDEALALQCKQWTPDFEELDDKVTGLIVEGYKLQTQWDEKNQCFACYCFVVGTKTPNTGLILAGRGSTGLKAIRQVIFKHYVALKGVWPRPKREIARNAIDD
jgi:hypothetical protein